jgi:hypothetical protein
MEIIYRLKSAAKSIIAQIEYILSPITSDGITIGGNGNITATYPGTFTITTVKEPSTIEIPSEKTEDQNIINQFSSSLKSIRL